MMEAVRTSETSANFYQTTRRNIPEDRHLRWGGKTVNTLQEKHEVSFCGSVLIL
jgi:hypothetical protein